jgi:hypothetical protein
MGLLLAEGLPRVSDKVAWSQDYQDDPTTSPHVTEHSDSHREDDADQQHVRQDGRPPVRLAKDAIEKSHEPIEAEAVQLDIQTRLTSVPRTLPTSVS